MIEFKQTHAVKVLLKKYTAFIAPLKEVGKPDFVIPDDEYKILFDAWNNSVKKYNDGIKYDGIVIRPLRKK